MNRVIYRDSNERGKSKKIAQREFLKSWNFYYSKKLRKKQSIKSLKISKNTDIDLFLKNLLNSKD